MTIDSITPESLTKKRGFRSRNPYAMTNAEKQQRYRRKLSGRNINYTLPHDVAAGILYLRREWGMNTDNQVLEAAVRFLTLCTRQGLQRLPQSIDD